MTAATLLIPDWPAPAPVAAVSTTRLGGVSQPPFDSFNLGLHVGDDAQRVKHNRALLQQQIGADIRCQWLQQVHGIEVIEAQPGQGVPEADGCFTRQPGVACLVMTADCLPVLFCDRAGTRVAAAHAGWRGLAAGVLETTVERLRCPPEELLCWLGPAIGPDAFEVGPEVRETFCGPNPEAAPAFRPAGSEGKWLADLYRLARLRLSALGIQGIYGGEYCTYSDRQRFFSYRRDGASGRMASLIWLRR